MTQLACSLTRCRDTGETSPACGLDPAGPTHHFVFHRLLGRLLRAVLAPFIRLRRPANCTVTSCRAPDTHGKALTTTSTLASVEGFNPSSPPCAASMSIVCRRSMVARSVVDALVAQMCMNGASMGGTPKHRPDAQRINHAAGARQTDSSPFGISRPYPCLARYVVAASTTARRS